MRKPECTVVHEDFRIEYNAESTLFSRPLFIIGLHLSSASCIALGFCVYLDFVHIYCSASAKQINLFCSRLLRIFAENFFEMKQIIATENAPKAVGPYSQAVEVNGTLYISGQIPVVPADGSVPESIEAQTRQSLKNIGAILEKAGMQYSNVVKTTVLLNDIADFSAMNAVYSEFFTDEKPARACYQVAALPMGVKVEIEAVAVR